MTPMNHIISYLADFNKSSEGSLATFDVMVQTLFNFIPVLIRTIFSLFDSFNVYVVQWRETLRMIGVLRQNHPLSHINQFLVEFQDIAVCGRILTTFFQECFKRY